MSSCNFKRENAPPVVAIDLIALCDGHPQDYKPSSCPRASKVKMMCTEPIPMTITTRTSERDNGPIGRITKHKDFDVRAGRKVFMCMCEKRNGLQDECDRVSCQNNPGCKMTPPKCWPKYKPKPAKEINLNGHIRMCFMSDQNTCE